MTFTRRLSLLAPFVALATAGCRQDVRPPSPPPPHAEFLVAAGDSTFWVRTAADGVRRRGSSLMLARFGGELYELYTADEDRSFYDALFVGQRVYRRDLVSGDSALVYRDTVVPGAERHWAALHPDDSPLRPDEDASEHPVATATADVQLLDVHEAFLSIEHHTDIDVGGVRHVHRTVRRVVDLRSRRNATVVEAFGDSAGGDALRRGAALFAAARDSIRATRDPRGDAARDAFTDLTFDPRSFSLGDVGGAPAVTFFVPASGERGRSATLPLQPIVLAAPAWWRTDVAPGLPASRDSVEDHWAGHGYTVRARYDTSGESAALSISDTRGREWSLGEVPTPVRRVLWLDAPAIDSLHREALARAFDDAVLYDDAARLASRPHHARARTPVRLASRTSKQRAVRTRSNRSRHSPT